MVRLILLLFIIGLCQLTYYSQTKRPLPCVHDTLYKTYERILVLPVEVVSVANNKVYYIFEDTKEIVYGSVILVDKTNIPKNFFKEYTSKRWLIFFCRDHFTLYKVAELVKE